MRPSSRAAPGDAAVGGQHPVRPGDGLGVRRQRGVDRRDLGRVDAQLGAEAVPSRPGQVGQQPGLVVQLGGDPGDRRGQPGDAGRDGQPAGRVAQPVRRLSRCRGRGPARGPGCRTPAGSPRRPRRPRRPARPRARSRSGRAPRTAGRRRRGPLGHLLDRLGLGQHHRLQPALGDQLQVSATCSGDPASLIRTTRGPGRSASAVAAHGPTAARASALASAATASSRSSTTASAPLASAFANRSGPVAGHEQVGPGSRPSQIAPAVAQRVDLLRVVAQLDQHGVGVLAQRRHGIHPRLDVPAARRQQRGLPGLPTCPPRATGRGRPAAGAPTRRAWCSPGRWRSSPPPAGRAPAGRSARRRRRR